MTSALRESLDDVTRGPRRDPRDRVAPVSLRLRVPGSGFSSRVSVFLFRICIHGAAHL